jgi:5-formyltetrahydrofolate cyclo-ligase
MTKTKLRKEMKKKLAGLPGEEAAAKSAAILSRLLATQAWLNSELVLCYISMSGEVETSRIIAEAFRSGKLVFAPRCGGSALVFHKIESIADASALHPYGMNEPEPELPQFPDRISAGITALVIVPGLAFDREKNRLGRGKGFYDRYLRELSEKYNRGSFIFAGICFHLQLCDEIPVAAQDVPMDLVISDQDLVS